MCLSIPSKVIAIDSEKNFATVDTMGIHRSVALDLMEDESVTVGDYVLIHIGFIMNKIDETDAVASLQTYQELLAEMDESQREKTILDDDNCSKRDAK